MFNRYLLLLATCLLASCALPSYNQTLKTLGPNPATLRVSKINTFNITRSSLSILRHEVNCKEPGKTAARTTLLGYTENPKFKAKSKEPPYSVQIPGNNQQILIDLGFIKDYFGQQRLCYLTFSFVPEAGAVYQLNRSFDTSFGSLGGCGFDIAKVIVTEHGETMEKLKDYRWGMLAGFEHATYMCDETGNYTLLPRKRIQSRAEIIKNASDDPPRKEAYIPFIREY